MNPLRRIIRESIEIAENIQQADKIYFNTGKLSPEVKKYITHITQGDAWTKLLSDIYYAEIRQQKKQGAASMSLISDEPEEEISLDGQNDVMGLEDWKKIRETHNQLKAYNKNVFPIKGFNINGVKDIWNLISGLKQRASILELIKKLPSAARRNMTNDIRTERTYPELQDYRSKLEYFLGQYSQLSNRSPRAKSVIDKKMFKSGITLKDLIDFAEDKQNLIGGKQLNRSVIKKILNEYDYDLEVVYDKGNVMVIDVTGPDGIKALGCNSVWCFTYGGTSGAYRSRGSWGQNSTNGQVYVIIDFSQESDSPYFMYTIIKPLDFTSHTDHSMGDVKNQEKMANMSNEYVDNPLDILSGLMGAEDAYQIINFGEERVGPNSEWPHKDPNQTKLDLQEVRLIMRREIKKQLNESDDIDWELHDLMDDVKYKMFGEYISAVEKEKPDPENGKYLKARQPWTVVPFAQLKTVWEAFIDQGKVPDRMWVMLDKIEEVITENICKININTEMAGHSPNSPKEEWRQYLGDDASEEYIDYLDASFGEWIEDKSGQWRLSDYGLKPLNIKLAELRKIGIPEKKLKKIDEILNVVHQRSDIAGWFVEGGSSALSQLSGMEEEMNEVAVRKIIRKIFLNEAKKSKFEKLKDNKVPLTDEEREKVMTAKAVWHHGPNREETPAVWKSKDKKTGKFTYICHTHRAYNTAPTLKGAISRFHKFIKGTA